MALGGTAFKLRSSPHLDPYGSMSFTASADRSAGDMITAGDTIGVVVSDTDSGDDGVLVYRAAKIVVPCATVTTGNIDELAVGCKVYYQAIHGNVSDQSGGTLCGTVTEAPTAGDTTIEIDLDGRLGITS